MKAVQGVMMPLFIRARMVSPKMVHMFLIRDFKFKIPLF